MLAPDHAVSEFALPALDVRGVLRRVAPPALIACVAVAFVLLAGGRVQAFADGVRRGLDVSPGWAALGVVFECLSLAGYVALLSLVAGRATPRVGARESAQITLAGAAATRLLPTAGAGGIALTLWTLRKAGLRSRAATRTLLVFLIVLFSIFLSSIALSGVVLTLGLVNSSGPAELSAIPAVAAVLAIALCLGLAARRGVESKLGDRGSQDVRGRRTPVGANARLIGDAVGEAC